jgi:hypothetical protein
MNENQSTKRKQTLVKNSSTLFLRLVVVTFALIILSLCVVVLPIGIATDQTGLYRWILVGLYVPAIPFFYAIFQTMKLLGYIDRNMAFSEESVSTLKAIKNCAAIIAGLFTAGMPYIFYAADKDDAPGVVAIGLVIIAASIVISVFAAVLQKLLKNALDIKAENDLTV